MPVPDPRAGQAFICLITFFLFLSIAVGGSCLIAYTVLPYPPSWLSYVGIAFVCLPWLFWLLTFVYRILSRSLGFRMVVGSGGHVNGDTMPRDMEPPGRNLESPNEETGMAEQVHHDDGTEKKPKKRTTSASSSSSDASNESELPLAISMGA